VQRDPLAVALAYIKRDYLSRSCSRRAISGKLAAAAKVAVAWPAVLCDVALRAGLGSQ